MQQIFHIGDLALDSLEKNLGLLQNNLDRDAVYCDPDPMDEAMYQVQSEQFFDGLIENHKALTEPCGVRECQNFCALIQRVCVRSLTEDDAPYLVAMSVMVQRLKPSMGVLSAALAEVFSGSDGSRPEPKLVHDAIVRAKERVAAIGEKIKMLKEKV